MITQFYINKVVTIFILLVMPILHHLTRYEANEAHRAGLLAMSVMLVIPFVIRILPRYIQSHKYFFGAITLFCVALVVSTLFGINPLRSFVGDSMRRMGLLTQFAMIACVFLMAGTAGKQLWFYFWIGTLFVSAHIFLEATELSEMFLRIQGLFGWTTLTGGWLLSATIWMVIGFIAYGYAHTTRLQRAVVLISWAGIGVAFVILGARASALATSVGLLFAVWIWAVKQQHRRLLFGVLILAIAGGGAVFTASRIYYGDNPISSAFLLQRLKYPVFNSFREQVWNDSLQIIYTQPRLMRYDGTFDSLHRIRSLIGYGAEAFEPAQKRVTLDYIPAVDDNLRIDRAHNIWYDTFIMYGLLGVLSFGSMFVIAIGIALRKLHLLNRFTLSGAVAGCVIGAIISPEPSFTPAIMTFGAIGGLMIGITLSLLRPSSHDTDLDVNALIAICILIAHLIELQFGFVTIATALIPWLAMGLLFVDEQDTSPFPHPPVAIVVALVGAFIIRLPLVSGWHNLILLSIALVVYVVWSRITIRHLVTIGGLWLLAGLNRLIPVPELVVVWDIGLVVISLWLLYNTMIGSITIHLTTGNLLTAIAVTLIGALWVMDILAGTYRMLSAQSPIGSERAEYLSRASVLRPYDDRLWHLAGDSNLTDALFTQNPITLNRAVTAYQLAITINPYDSDYTLSRALLEAQLSQLTTQRDEHIKQARTYFEHATMMSPRIGAYWREWARFEWFIGEDDVRARVAIQQAMMLSPDDTATLALFETIDGN